MSKYYITIFSIAAIITGGVFLTSQVLQSSRNQVKTEAQNSSNVAVTPSLQPQTPQASAQAQNSSNVAVTPSSQPQTLQASANESPQKNQLQQQLAILEQDLKQHQKNGDVEQEIRTLGLIVISYIELSEYTKALEYLQLAQTKLNQSNLSAEKKSLIEPELLVVLGTIYADQGNYTQVLEIVRKIDEIQKSRIGSLGDVRPRPEKKPVQPDVRQDAQRLYLIAITQQKRGKTREALRTAEEVLKMLKTVEEKQGEEEVTKFINTLRQQL
ncbi:MAG TPA: hypothetical protein VK184_09800 [Nostocaceae cyanobacterium]|nr:hypothetical protein [Nostocaceae cyanobacterium]